MDQLANRKRPACPQCLRPRQTCICKWARPVQSLVELLILQHPLEVNQAKGSARLLHLSLPGSRVAIGERFEEAELHALLYDSTMDASPVDEGNRSARQPILLYPQFDAGHPSLHTAPHTEQRLPTKPEHCRLVVLDGTWRKSRKMMYHNPLLSTLPRLALQNAPASHYSIRKAHGPDQLSTFEAVCYALMQLEQNKSKYESLLVAFSGFVAEQLDRVGGADSTRIEED